MSKMAICTNCGTILHEDDIKNHICNPLTIAEKGKEKTPTTTEKVI